MISVVKNRYVALGVPFWIICARMTIAGLATLLMACASPIERVASTVPFFPIEREYFPLPNGVAPFMPTYTPDGIDIVFLNSSDRTVWIVGADGSDPDCIDCAFEDRPPADRSGGFVYAFSDRKRLLLTRGLGKLGGGTTGVNADAWVLECMPSIRNCESHRYMDVDMSADQGPNFTLHRRFWHLAPDETHLGWMNVRTDGTVMVVARLERKEDRYVAVDPRAVNPVGPESAEDTRADRWERFTQLYELKGFTPDGKSVLAVGLPNHNIDVLQIELASGQVQRLTAHPDWDEDSSLSPDQQLFAVNSWRGRNRFDVFSWIPQIRGFSSLMLGAALAPHYVSTWTGFQCNLSPWLLPATGDDGGRLVGQPLDVYSDKLTASANVAGRYVWSPDSTKVLLMEQTRLPPPGQGSPYRLAIAKLKRDAGVPVPISSSRIGDWAVSAGRYQGPHAVEQSVEVKGDHGGVARMKFSGLLGKDAATTVEFDRFTDDGETYVNGMMKAVSQDGTWQMDADVTVSGENTGKLSMNLVFDNKAKPLPLKEGTITSVYNGKTAPSLPDLAACHDRIPKPSPLDVVFMREENHLTVKVSANVHTDVRPVAGATVSIGSTEVHTDSDGMARLRLPDDIEQQVVRVSAGDTFVPYIGEVD